MATLVQATLIKRKTDDGFVEMHDDVPLGKTYIVILETRRPLKQLHITTGTIHTKDSIQDITGGWLPVELLEIPCHSSSLTAKPMAPAPRADVSRGSARLPGQGRRRTVD